MIRRLIFESNTNSSSESHCVSVWCPGSGHTFIFRQCLLFIFLHPSSRRVVAHSSVLLLFSSGGSNDSTSCRRPHASKSQLRTVVSMHGRTEDSLRQGTAVIIVSLTARAMPASPRDSLLTGEMRFDCGSFREQTTPRKQGLSGQAKAAQARNTPIYTNSCYCKDGGSQF